MPPRGLQAPFVPDLNYAVGMLLALLYPAPRQPIARLNDPKVDRNSEIRELYAEGWNIPTLAARFGISSTRVNQILHKPA